MNHKHESRIMSKLLLSNVFSHDFSHSGLLLDFILLPLFDEYMI